MKSSAVDFVQDGDLNKSLKHLVRLINHIDVEIIINIISYLIFQCLEILDENEEAILKLFMAEMKLNDIDLKVCTETAKYCNDDVSEETYNDEL